MVKFSQPLNTYNANEVNLKFFKGFDCFLATRMLPKAKVTKLKITSVETEL